MGDIGVPELVIILLIIVVLFGANRLNGLGSALGGTIREFKAAVREEPSDPTASPAPTPEAPQQSDA